MAQNRLFIHPITTNQRIHIKHFRKLKQGTTADNFRLTHFERVPNNKVVHPAYSGGIMIEYPNGQTATVFGNYNEIAGIAKEIESNPKGVLDRVRPTGQSPGNNFYLGQPPPAEPQQKLTPKEMSEAATPHKLFKNQGSEDYPRTRMAEEKAAAMQHIKEVATEKYGGTHPSSADGQQAIKTALDAATGKTQRQTSLVGGQD